MLRGSRVSPPPQKEFVTSYFQQPASSSFDVDLHHRRAITTTTLLLLYVHHSLTPLAPVHHQLAPIISGPKCSASGTKTGPSPCQTRSSTRTPILEIRSSSSGVAMPVSPARDPVVYSNTDDRPYHTPPSHTSPHHDRTSPPSHPVQEPTPPEHSPNPCPPPNA